MAKVVVMAESLQHFRQYVKDNNLNEGHFQYIGREIRGRRGVILAVGRYWRNPFYKDIEFIEYLNACVNAGFISLVPVVWDTEAIYDLFRL